MQLSATGDLLVQPMPCSHALRWHHFKLLAEREEHLRGPSRDRVRVQAETELVAGLLRRGDRVAVSTVTPRCPCSGRTVNLGS